MQAIPDAKGGAALLLDLRGDAAWLKIFSEDRLAPPWESFQPSGSIIVYIARNRFVRLYLPFSFQDSTESLTYRRSSSNKCHFLQFEHILKCVPVQCVFKRTHCIGNAKTVLNSTARDFGFGNNNNNSLFYIYYLYQY